MRDGSGMSEYEALKISVTERLQRHRPWVYSRKVVQRLPIQSQLPISRLVVHEHNFRDADFWGFDIKVGKQCGVFGELCCSAEKDPQKTEVFVAAYNCREFTTYI